MSIRNIFGKKEVIADLNSDCTAGS